MKQHQEYVLELLEEIEDIHYYLQTYKVGEQIELDPDIAAQFRSVVDFVMRSYIHFAQASIQKDSHLYDVKNNLGYAKDKIEVMERMIKRNSDPTET